MADLDDGFVLELLRDSEEQVRAAELRRLRLAVHWAERHAVAVLAPDRYEEPRLAQQPAPDDRDQSRKYSSQIQLPSLMPQSLKQYQRLPAELSQ